MISVALIAFFAAASHAIVMTKINKISTETEDFKHVCPKTGYTVVGHAWWKCHEGKTRVMGCVTLTGDRISFGETFEDQNALWKCSEADGVVILEPAACIVDGEIMQVGQRGRHGSVWISCTRVGDGSLTVDIIGCSDTEGLMVSIGGRFDKGKYKYECEDSGYEVFQKVVMCLINDRWYSIGSQVKSGDFIMECQRKGDRSARIEVVGCAGSMGELLGAGETIIRGTIVYQCVEDEDSGFKLAPIGCYAKDFQNEELKEYLFGERWVDTYSDSIKLVMECQEKDASIGPEIVGCRFVSEEETEELDVGCARQVGEHVLMCKKAGEGSVLARKKKISKRNGYEDIMREAGVPLC